MAPRVDHLTIGALAKAAGVDVETIRFYQRKGLLPTPDRPYGGIRRYGREDLARLQFIQKAKRLGFRLDEIAELLALADGSHCAEARALAERKLADVRARLLELGRLEAVLADLVERCDAASGEVRCPLIEALERVG